MTHPSILEIAAVLSTAAVALLVPGGVQAAPITPAGLIESSNGDFDGDGVENSQDNAPHVRNPDQRDDDGDGIGSAWDIDPLDPAIRMPGVSLLSPNITIFAGEGATIRFRVDLSASVANPWASLVPIGLGDHAVSGYWIEDLMSGVTSDGAVGINADFIQRSDWNLNVAGTYFFGALTSFDASTGAWRKETGTVTVLVRSNAVPEPVTSALIAVGLVLCAGLSRQRGRKSWGNTFTEALRRSRTVEGDRT